MWIPPKHAVAAPDLRSVTVPPLRIATTRQTGGTLIWQVIDRAIAANADVIVLPEWMLKPERDYAAFKRDVERLRALSHGRLIVPGTFCVIDRVGRRRNLALAFADGRVLFTYAKQADGGDIRHAEALGVTWERGKRPGVFTWRGMQVGIEICADHREKLLRKHDGPALHLQILTADGMDLNPDAVAVGNGGLVIVCDQRSTTNGAHHMQDGVITKMPYTHVSSDYIMVSTFH